MGTASSNNIGNGDDTPQTALALATPRPAAEPPNNGKAATTRATPTFSSAAPTKKVPLDPSNPTGNNDKRFNQKDHGNNDDKDNNDAKMRMVRTTRTRRTLRTMGEQWKSENDENNENDTNDKNNGRILGNIRTIGTTRTTSRGER